MQQSIVQLRTVSIQFNIETQQNVPTDAWSNTGIQFDWILETEKIIRHDTSNRFATPILTSLPMVVVRRRSVGNYCF